MKPVAIGDESIANAVGIGNGGNFHRVRWCACPECNSERWVVIRKGVPVSVRCYACKHVGRKFGHKVGPGSPHWKGGRHVMANGYIRVRIFGDDPLFAMADKHGTVFEHRLVMARKLKRKLLRSEEVHHRNGNKKDNRLRNLELLDKGAHAAKTLGDVMALKAEIRRLRSLLNA